MDNRNVSKNKELEEARKSYNLLKEEMEEWKVNLLREHESKSIELEKSYKILEKEDDDLKLAVAQSNECMTEKKELVENVKLMECQNISKTKEIGGR